MIIKNCEHKEHDIVKVHVYQNGKPLPDLPSVKLDFEMFVFDFDKYKNTEGYCPADDEVSFSILSQKIWEGHDTILVQEIMNEKGIVIDVGANMGWYSIIAKDHPVIAYESDVVIADVLKKNLDLNCVKSYDIRNEWVDENSPKIYFEDVLFLKSDIEGLDKHAVAMCEDMFIKKTIKYALIEISPFLVDNQQELIDRIIGYGYNSYMIPEKGFEHTEEYESSPLETLKKYCGKTDIEGVRQNNYLFIRN